MMDALEYFIMHRSTYDPIKAREYYLRTRKLKGRRARSENSAGGRRMTKSEFRDIANDNGVRYQRPRTNKQARAQAEQRLEDLKNRLDRLRNLLSERVEAAKKRSGITDSSSDKSEKSSNSSSSSGGGKKNPPATAKEKRDAAKRARESYEKNKKTKPSKPDADSIAEQIEKVEEQIRDVRQKLQEATANARKKSEAKSKTKTETSKGRR